MKNFNLLRLTFLLIAAVTFTFCGGKSEEELLNSAKQNLESSAYEKALEDYTALYTEHPESEYAPGALFECGRMYQSFSIKKFTQEESWQKAAELYKKLVALYPNAKEAENALFSAGFIYANNLNQIDSARVSYTLFVEKYPESELVSSAKAELANLGRTPEEIIGKVELSKKPKRKK